MWGLIGAMAGAMALAAAGGRARPPEVSPEIRALVTRSIREYDAGDFALAFRDAKVAFEASGLPALLFNLGQCERALGAFAKAEFYYQGYLRENPAAKNRAVVRRLIAEVHALARATPANPPRPSPVVAPAPAPILVTRPAAPPPAPVVAPAPILVTVTSEAARPKPPPKTIAAAREAPAAPTGSAEVSARERVRSHRLMLYGGVALLAGAGVAGWYAGNGLSAAATERATEARASAADGAFYGPRVSALQGLGVGTLVTGIVLAVTGATLVWMGTH